MKNKKQMKDEKLSERNRTTKLIARLLEFFIIGVAFGIFEDMLAITFYTHEAFSLDMLVIAAIVAIPFAVFSELIVDHQQVFKRFVAWFRNKN